MTTSQTTNPFGVGAPFEIIVPDAVRSFAGNVIVPAGTYMAQQSSHAPEGTVSIWSPEHYAGPMFASIPPWLWAFPGESSRPMPAHDCVDHLRSGIAGGLFCAICQERLG